MFNLHCEKRDITSDTFFVFVHPLLKSTTTFKVFSSSPLFQFQSGCFCSTTLRSDNFFNGVVKNGARNRINKKSQANATSHWWCGCWIYCVRRHVGSWRTPETRHEVQICSYKTAAQDCPRYCNPSGLSVWVWCGGLETHCCLMSRRLQSQSAHEDRRHDGQSRAKSRSELCSDPVVRAATGVLRCGPFARLQDRGVPNLCDLWKGATGACCCARWHESNYPNASLIYLPRLRAVTHEKEPKGRERSNCK